MYFMGLLLWVPGAVIDACMEKSELGVGIRHGGKLAWVRGGRVEQRGARSEERGGRGAGWAMGDGRWRNTPVDEEPADPYLT
jgi:hypothetical protein